jgi:DNA-binding PadR family transcriptional regulator
MRSLEDELVVAMSHGIGGWVIGSSVNAQEVAVFVEVIGNRALPSSADDIDQLLTNLNDAGLVAYRSRTSAVGSAEPYRSYVLTPDGWARARELEDADRQPPPIARGDASTG